MSVLQWALLILGAVAVIAVYVAGRGQKPVAKRSWPQTGASPNANLPAAEQADLFSRGQQYDEFGVGKPRKRTEPLLQAQPQKGLFESAPEPAPKPSVAPITARKTPKMESRTEPPAAAVAPPVEASTPPASKPKPEEKIIALLIAEREGTAIFGPKLHAALQQQKLQYGARQIYHRMEQGMVVFSVASLLKPGALDPMESATFSTPGLSVFMLLPGPVKPVTAFQDMVSTARALAASLNAEVYDSKRQPFNAENERVQKAEVEAWARANHLA